MDERELEDSTAIEIQSTDDEAKSAISADLIRGHINTIILRTLYERDKYGYEIIEEIEKKSHGQYSLKQPTLYSALKRLETQGYINAYWKTDEVSLGGRRKYYTLTDSGREITEKNQAEWEYSRTVIDNLISDRSFDFSQPAPTPVDFKILKKSTSRVPVMKDTESFEIKQKEEAVITEKKETSEDFKPEPKPEPPIPQMSEAERKAVHENYLRLIAEPAPQPKKEVEVMPVADKIDTEKLIYNNKPETERDNRNLINNLFDKTVKNNPPPIREDNVVVTNYPSERPNDLLAKAEADGLKINSTEYIVNNRRKSYNLGGTLLKCSLIIAVIMMFEFALCLLFKKELEVNLAYPFVIFSLALAQLAIFAVLYYTDIGKIMRRPSSSIYLTACFIVTIIVIAIIFLVSILLKVNFAAVSDIFSKIIIPIFVALNIPTFAVCFYAFSK
ncbi:MAG: PadR family transcriptional regulator [Clostridia bacterium]|nr:PadR family transcriptional regulator [Clostridia bacterium]